MNWPPSYRQCTDAAGSPQGGNRTPQRGFSLTEVALALGIVSFGLLSIIGLYGGMLGNSRDIVDRREMGEVTDSLRTFLNEQKDFSQVYTWTKSETKELFYVNYRTVSTSPAAGPDISGDVVVGAWMDPEQPPEGYPEKYDAAREGRWLRAKLRLAPTNSPASLPATAGEYLKPLLVVQVDFAAMADPSHVVSDTPTLTTQIGVLR